MRPRAHPRYVRGWNRLTMKVRFKLSRVGAGQHARGQQRDGRSQAAQHFYRFKLDTCMGEDPDGSVGLSGRESSIKVGEERLAARQVRVRVLSVNERTDRGKQQ
jgi:hypothetical protein